MLLRRLTTSTAAAASLRTPSSSAAVTSTLAKRTIVPSAAFSASSHSLIVYNQFRLQSQPQQHHLRQKHSLPHSSQPSDIRAISQFHSSAFSTSSAAAVKSPPPSSPLPSSTPSSVQSKPNTNSLDFDDVSQSFSIKSTWELLRGLLVFQLCGIRPLVTNARMLLGVSERLLGRRLTEYLLKQTFFGHFCAGETNEEVARVIKKLEASGLGGILDYAAEADLSTAPQVQKRDRTGVNSARIYDYEGESECDANAQICAQCIEAAGMRQNGQAFAAIKLTALGKPELLEHLSKILTETKRLFVQFTEAAEKENAASSTSSSPSPSSSSSSSSSSITSPNPNPSISIRTKLTFPSFYSGLQAINVHLDQEKAKKLFARIDMDHSGAVDYIDWITFLDPKLLGGLNPKFKSEGLSTLSEDDLNKVKSMITRLEGLADLAARKNVKLMIDAEQTYFQPGIDHLVLDLQRKYNTHGKAIIFNTYQCYLKDSASRMLLDLERSQREGFRFAAKIVRGAYMIQERARAKQLGYVDPIQPDLESTHRNYHDVVEKLLRHTKPEKAEVLVASHNEKTVKYVTDLMEELHIPRSQSNVYFGQLLGMCDHVSYSLGHCGYQVFKYVPYGPVHDVIPYLIRRAEENSGMLGGAVKERKLLRKELWRRMTGGGSGK